jgi:hypothetical protein
MPSIPLFHEAAPAYSDIYAELDSLAEPSLILLRGHLLIEVLLREFVASKARTPTAIDDAKLSFGQALNIARSHFDEDTPIALWRYLARVNHLRNTLAHNLDTSRFDLEWRSLVKSHRGEFASSGSDSDIDTFKHLLISIASNLVYLTQNPTMHQQRQE